MCHVEHKKVIFENSAVINVVLPEMFLLMLLLILYYWFSLAIVAFCFLVQHLIVKVELMLVGKT